MSDDSMSKSCSAKQSAERIPKFVGIIYQMIEDPRYQEYVGWSADGCAMLIKKPTEFAEYALPIFFKHNNFSSFVRQLNLYSFRKKKHYPFDNAFVHPMFKKGQKGLLKYIKRKGNDKFPLPSQDASRVPMYGVQEENTCYEELIRQNAYLKKVHQDLSEHVQNVEKRIMELNQQNQVLVMKFEKKKQDEELLKKVVKELGVIYGTEAIKPIFNAVIQESHNGKSLEIKADQKAMEGYFEEKLETDHSTATQEKSLEEMVAGLSPKRMNTNFSNCSFQKAIMQKRTSQGPPGETHEIFFDGNFNPFLQNFQGISN